MWKWKKEGKEAKVCQVNSNQKRFIELYKVIDSNCPSIQAEQTAVIVSKRIRNIWIWIFSQQKEWRRSASEVPTMLLLFSGALVFVDQKEIDLVNFKL